MSQTRSLRWLVLCGLLLPLSATLYAQTDPAPPSLAAVIAAHSDLTTLKTALDAGELAATLADGGPFTVFAPTNAAFDALPEGTLEALLQADQMNRLKEVLTFHVVPGRWQAADLVDGMELETVQGQKLVVAVSEGTVTVGGAVVGTTDVPAGNGWIHVVDRVLLPTE